MQLTTYKLGSFSIIYLVTVTYTLVKVIYGNHPSYDTCKYVTSSFKRQCSSGTNGHWQVTDGVIKYSKKMYLCARKCDIHCESFTWNSVTEACVLYTMVYDCNQLPNLGTGLQYYLKVNSGADCTDPCASLPCLNDGTCLSSNSSSYTCQCSEWFSGVHCETAVIGIEAVCDWHHGQLYVDGQLISSQSGHSYPYIHRVKVPTPIQVIAVYCEDDTYYGGNDGRSFMVVSLSTGEASGDQHWLCTSSYQTGWMNINYVDNTWQTPQTATFSSSMWTLNDLIYKPSTSTPRWAYLLTRHLYCRYDRRKI